jgi:hypothetical protein
MMKIAFQLPLRPALSRVVGNVDYTRQQVELGRIAELLVKSGAERDFIERSVVLYVARAESAGTKVSQALLSRHQARSVTVLRCMILMSILGEDFRGMSRRLAECQLFRHFCELECLGDIRVPSKSALQKYSQWLPEAEMREVVGKLLQAAGEGRTGLELANDVELGRVWLDSTCVKANIHFPVDWVLLRDGVRTLMKATELIRRHGLKSRMEEPGEFLRSMNRLSIEMTQSRRAKDAKRLRKKTLRKMKKLVRVVTEHAQRHRDLLDQEWESTDWTRKQADQVLGRINSVLKLLPKARKQAHERIIGERQVKSSEKLLSLYETEARIIVRGKAGAEVEFGNTLLLAEQENGLLVDWEFHRESAPADSKLLSSSVTRISKLIGKPVKVVTTDRGFDSAENTRLLSDKGIVNNICPKSPRLLAERMTDPQFVAAQKRRGSTEGRIGVFKNVFLGSPLRAKRAHRRALAISWRVLAHNLWVLARLPKAKVAESPPLKAAA